MKKEFTIMEMAVVLAIMGLMVALAFVFFEEVTVKSRDNKRISHMREISTALGLYFTNHGGFPVTNGPVVLTGEDPVSKELVDDYVISRVPADPLYPLLSYSYESSDGFDYVLTFCLEKYELGGYSVGCTNTLSP